MGREVKTQGALYLFFAQSQGDSRSGGVVDRKKTASQPASDELWQQFLAKYIKFH
jgi:hypothetical protein